MRLIRARELAGALAAVAALMSAAACHLVYPFDVGAGVEAGPGSDAGPDADAGVDACVEKATINPGGACSAQCIEPTAETDCDGLIDKAEDPWPTSCNTLMLSEELAAPPWTRWELTYAPAAKNTGPVCGSSGYRCLPADTCHAASCKTTRTWSCGKLRLEPGQTFRLIDAGSLFDPTYLVELRFSITKIIDSQRWSFGVTGNDDTTAPYRRSCAIWLDRLPNKDCPTGCSKVVGLHLNHTIPQGSSGAWSSDTADPVKDPLHRTFRLQLWGDKDYQRCDLVSDDGAQRIVAVPFPSTHRGLNFNPVSPGTIHLTATGCQVTLEHLRVFDHAL